MVKEYFALRTPEYPHKIPRVSAMYSFALVSPSINLTGNTPDGVIDAGTEGDLSLDEEGNPDKCLGSVMLVGPVGKGSLHLAMALWRLQQRG